jgi:predicted nucleic acid-binding protein
MTRLVVLDNEAVQALQDSAHPKHRQVVSQAQVVASRKRRAAAIEIVVPTAVRVEAGWDRTSPAWAFPNRLRIADIPLDAANASTAAAIRSRTRVSVADAHLGAVIQAAPAGQITVVTSDPGDMRLVAGDRDITVAAI